MTTKLHPLRVPACLLAAAASLAAGTALAQAPTLRETRVTATRFAEPEASLPLGVSVIGADEIRASGATSVTDAIVRLLGVPGRHDLTNGGDFSVDLRGFGTTADNNQVVVLDGLRLTESDLSSPRLAGIPIEAVERIEVLRGSGAVLYGEGATGGVIVITTKAGAGREQRTGGSAYAGIGSHALRDVRASGTFASGTGLSLDVHGQKRETKGYRQNAASDTEAATVTGQWSNDWLRLGARLAHDDLDARLPGALTAAQYAADPRQTATPSDFGRIRHQRLSVFGQAELGAWQLALDAGRRDKELRSSFTFPGLVVPVEYDVEAQTYSLRARHEAPIGDLRNVLVLGADRNTWDRRNIAGSFDASQSANAVYAKDDLVLAGGTRLSAGARTERLRKDAAGVPLSDRQHAWELGASHPFATAWTAYARVGRSFRLPNADEFSFTGPALLKAQTSRDVELGARWSHAGGRLEARLFHSALDNEIGFDPAAVGPFGPFGANVNFDPSRRQGVELDWHQAWNAALATRVNATLREATFRSGPYAGKDVPLVPRASLAVRADWTPAPGHRVHGGVNWVSSQHPDFNNTCRMPSYTTADARYSWQFHPSAELGVGVTNLFDRNYYTQAFACAGTAPSALYPEPGRQFTASLRVQF